MRQLEDKVKRSRDSVESGTHVRHMIIRFPLSPPALHDGICNRGHETKLFGNGRRLARWTEFQPRKFAVQAAESLLKLHRQCLQHKFRSLDIQAS